MKETRVRKVGRNASCECGSGKKYKKCCLNMINQKNLGQELIDSSMNRLMERNNDGEPIVYPDDIGIRKTSEIILEYAEEFLDLTDTRQEKEDIIDLAIAAWNISFADKAK